MQKYVFFVCKKLQKNSKSKMKQDLKEINYAEEGYCQYVKTDSS